MDTLRGPQSTDTMFKTDTRTPEQVVFDWTHGRTIFVNGTIDKSGEGHTELGIRISPEDILALHGALIEDFRKTDADLRSQITRLESHVQALTTAMAKLHALLDRKRLALAKRVSDAQIITSQYRLPFLLQSGRRPILKFAKWDRL